MKAARYQYYPTPSAQVLRDGNDYTTVLALQQPLWAGGRLTAGLDAAQARTRAGQAAITDAQYNLALRMTAAWAAWVQASGRSRALADGVTLLKIYAESVNRRIESGAAGEVDRELVTARLAQTEGDLIASRSAERSALARISQMIGRPLQPQEVDDVEAASAAFAVSGSAEIQLSDLEALLARALAHSAALQRLQGEIEAAGYETARRRGALWPTLNLRAQHQRNDTSGSGATADDSRMMLVFEYNPGAGLSAGADIEAAESRRLAQGENFEATRRELIERITADYEEHLASRARRHNLERTVKASAGVLASYDRLFIAGKRGWLDVINAARELIQARTALAETQALLLAAHARLHLHAGDLTWQQAGASQ